MKLTAVNTESAAAPAGPYSQAIVTNGFAFVSGQRPVDPETGEIPDGFAAQADQVLKNLAAVLDAAGSGLENVVRVSIYLADIGAFAEVNEVYARYFSDPFPARTTTACTLRGILVEIDAIAAI
jgi:2-iminobutanoate/2-iminopropanoate deaminase